MSLIWSWTFISLLIFLSLFCGVSSEYLMSRSRKEEFGRVSTARMLLNALKPGEAGATFEALQAAEPAGERVAQWRRHICLVLDALVDEQALEGQRLFDRGPALAAFAAEEDEARGLAGREQGSDLRDFRESH